VSDPTPERLRLAEFLIDVMREEITGVSGMNHDVRFRDGPSLCAADAVEFVIVEVTDSFHGQELFHL
jgi:hypothetical protein